MLKQSHSSKLAGMHALVWRFRFREQMLDSDALFEIAFDHVTRGMVTHSAREAAQVAEPSRRTRRTVTGKKDKARKLLEGQPFSSDRRLTTYMFVSSSPQDDSVHRLPAGPANKVLQRAEPWNALLWLRSSLWCKCGRGGANSTIFFSSFVQFVGQMFGIWEFGSIGMHPAECGMRF